MSDLWSNHLCVELPDIPCLTASQNSTQLVTLLGTSSFASLVPRLVYGIDQIPVLEFLLARFP